MQMNLLFRGTYDWELGFCSSTLPSAHLGVVASDKALFLDSRASRAAAPEPQCSLDRPSENDSPVSDASRGEA